MNFINFLFLLFSAPTFLIAGTETAASTSTKHANSRKNATNPTAATPIPSRVNYLIFRNQSVPVNDEIADVAEQPADDGEDLQEEAEHQVQ
jgi:hypothetical protein